MRKVLKAAHKLPDVSPVHISLLFHPVGTVPFSLHVSADAGLSVVGCVLCGTEVVTEVAGTVPDLLSFVVVACLGGHQGLSKLYKLLVSNKTPE